MDFETLIQQPESRRDDRWEQDFLNQFANLKVQVESEDVKQGPDGWPYLFVRTHGEQTTESVTSVMSWLAGRGIGMAVNAHKMLPDYIFPYGMVWNFVETGRFLQPPPASAPAGPVDYSNTKGLLMGPPSDQYLPPYVRAVIREFLQSKSFTQPKTLVISTADYAQVDLLLSTDSLAGLQPDKHQELAESVAWFLPMHYTLVLGQEKGFPPFTDL
jgi:hypothetical protein